MNDGLKQRLVGAFVLFAVAVIFLPGVLREQQPEPVDTSTQIPERPVTDAVTFEEPQPPANVEAAPEPDTMFMPDESTQVVVDTLDEAQALAAEDAETDKPAQAEQPSSDGAWVVQVASFASNQAAINLRDRLQNDGYKAYTREADVKGTHVTRVYVGPKVQRAEADRVKESIDQLLKVESLVLRFSP